MVRWEAQHFPQDNIMPIEQYIQAMVYKEKEEILTFMKLLHFIIWNDQSLLHFVQQWKI